MHDKNSSSLTCAAKFSSFPERSLGKAYLSVVSKGFCAEKKQGTSFQGVTETLPGLCKLQQQPPWGSCARLLKQGIWTKLFSKQKRNNKNKTLLCWTEWNSEAEPCSGSTIKKTIKIHRWNFPIFCKNKTKPLMSKQNPKSYKERISSSFTSYVRTSLT